MVDGLMVLILVVCLVVEGMVEEFIVSYVDVNVVDEFGKLVLYWVVVVNNVEVILVLFKNGVNKDMQDSKEEIFLFLVVCEGSYEVVKLLLDYFVNCEIIDYLDRLLWDVVQERLYQDIVCLLD